MTEVTLGDLIEETLDSLYRATERPAQVVMGPDALDDENDTEFTLSLGSLAPTQLVEFGSEMMLVTDRSDDATPVYTVSRGYLATDKGAHNTNDVGLVDPPYGRAQVERWIRRAVSGLMNTELPYTETNVYQPVTNGGYIELPSDTIEVLQVRHFGVLDNRITEVGLWQFEDQLPTSMIPSGRALRVHSGVTAEDELMVTIRRPYSFVGSGEAATISLPVAGQDIPVLWASAYSQSRREISRGELDKIEEWSQEQAIRAGVNLRMIRDMWGEVYRRVDEAKRVHRLPKHRPFRKIPRGW